MKWIIYSICILSLGYFGFGEGPFIGLLGMATGWLVAKWIYETAINPQHVAAEDPALWDAAASGLHGDGGVDSIDPSCITDTGASLDVSSVDFSGIDFSSIN